MLFIGWNQLWATKLGGFLNRKSECVLCLGGASILPMQMGFSMQHLISEPSLQIKPWKTGSAQTADVQTGKPECKWQIYVMLLAELGVSRASGPPWSTKTCAASSLPPTKSLDSTFYSKTSLCPFPFTYSMPCSPVLLSHNLPASALQSHPPPPPLNSSPIPMPLFTNSILVRQSSFPPLLQHCPMYLLAAERISPCPSTLFSDHNFESISPTSLIFPMALHKAEGEKGGGKTDFQTSIEKQEEEEEQGWSASLHTLFLSLRHSCFPSSS